jgi:hypothetical protein
LARLAGWRAGMLLATRRAARGRGRRRRAGRRRRGGRRGGGRRPADSRSRPRSLPDGGGPGRRTRRGRAPLRRRRPRRRRAGRRRPWRGGRRRGTARRPGGAGPSLTAAAPAMSTELSGHGENDPERGRQARRTSRGRLAQGLVGWCVTSLRLSNDWGAEIIDYDGRQSDSEGGCRVQPQRVLKSGQSASKQRYNEPWFSVTTLPGRKLP